MKEKVYLYKLNKEKLLREESQLLGLLPEWRKEKVSKIKPENSRIQSIAAGRLLDVAISRYLNIEISEVKWDFRENYVQDSNEKPIINFYEYVKQKDKIFYNISHSGDYVAVIVGEEPVGIDVENKDDKDFKVAKRFFTSNEVAYISEDQCRFRDVWTMKEAFLKCVGTGINGSLGNFEGDLVKTIGEGSEVSEGVIVSAKDRHGNGYELQGKEYHFVTARIGDGDYSLTICAENPKLTLDIEWVEVLL